MFQKVNGIKTKKYFIPGERFFLFLRIIVITLKYNMKKIKSTFIIVLLLIFHLEAFSQDEIMQENKDKGILTIAVYDVEMAPVMGMQKKEEFSSHDEDQTFSDEEVFDVKQSGKFNARKKRNRSLVKGNSSQVSSFYDSVESIRNSLRVVLESNIVKTKKFECLQISQKTESSYSKIPEFIMSPIIVDFHDKFVEVPIEGSKILAKKKSFLLALEIKILNSATSSIIETYHAKITEEDLNPDFRNMNPSQTMSDIYLNDICQKISSKSIRGLIDAIFPAKIVSIDDGDIYIDRGSGSGFVNGDMIEVYKKGSEIKDPITGKVLGIKDKTIGFLKIVNTVNENLSECKIVNLNNGNKSINVGDFVRKSYKKNNSTNVSQSSNSNSVLEDNYDKKSKDELAKFNAVKSLRIRAADSKKELVKARQLRQKGESMKKEGNNLANRRDSIAGAGTTMARHVDNSIVRDRGERMMEEGEKMIEESKTIEDEIKKLYSDLYNSCDTILIKSNNGKEIVCIPLIFENGLFTVLVRDKVFNIKEDNLDNNSKKRIQIYKSM